mgnify:CR=1 FL=1
MNDFNLYNNYSDTNTLNGSVNIPWIEKQGIPYYIFAFFALVTVFFLYQIVGGLITLILFGVEPLENNLWGYRLATGIGQILFIFIPTMMLVQLATNRPKEYLRVSIPSIRALLLPVIGILSLQHILQIYLFFQEKIPLPKELQNILDKFKDLIENLYLQLISSSSLTELISVIVIVALIPAIAEEFMFRGLIQRSIEKSFAPVSSVIITGIIFGAYHLNPFSFIPLVIIGIYLGYILIRSGSIWVPVVAHFVNNAFACLELHFKLDDDYILLGKAGEMSAIALLAAFLLFSMIFLVSTFYFIRTTKSPVSMNPVERRG